MLVLTIVAIFGLAVGSFLNVLIVRLPQGEGISGRSRCRRCGAVIPWYRNLPVVSFALQRGRCAACRGNISWQYPAVELITGGLFALVAARHLGEPTALADVGWLLRDLTFTSVLIVVFAIDLQHYLILDAVTIPGALFAISANLILGERFVDLALGGILGAGFFAAQYLVSRGRWIGDGDIRLGLMLGLMLGPGRLVVALLIAYLVGALVAIILLSLRRRRLGSRLPLGTFLALGGFAVLLYGDALLSWYLGWLGFA